MGDRMRTRRFPEPPRPRTISELAKMSRAELMMLAAQHGIKTGPKKENPPNLNRSTIAASFTDDSDDEEAISTAVRIEHNYFSKEPMSEEEKKNKHLSIEEKLYQEKKERRIAAYKRQIDIETDLIEFCNHEIKKVKTDIAELNKKVDPIKPGTLEGKVFLWDFE